MTEEELTMKIYCLLQNYLIAKKKKDFNLFEFCQDYAKRIKGLQ